MQATPLYAIFARADQAATEFDLRGIDALRYATESPEELLDALDVIHAALGVPSITQLEKNTGHDARRLVHDLFDLAAMASIGARPNPIGTPHLFNATVDLRLGAAA